MSAAENRVPERDAWRRRLIVFIPLVAFLALAALWYFLRPRPQTPERVGVDQQQVVAQPPEHTAVDLPPLDQTDALVRELVRALSSHPVIASWLTTDQLIRNFTVSVANVADGDTPARHLHTIAPGRPFQVRKRGAVTYIDETTYRRFDGHAAAVAELDPKGAAQLYRRLKPRLDDAYRELAPNGDFDRTLTRAIVTLLETPIVEGPIAVTPTPLSG